MTTDYLDDSLPWRERMGMRFHLAICSFCRRHMMQVRATIALLGRLPPVPVPEAEEDRLLAQLRQPPQAPPAPF